MCCNCLLLKNTVLIFLITKGESPACAATQCTDLWAPEEQEQRYCWGCRKWYHLECLEPSSPLDQSTYFLRVAEDPQFQDVPKSILRVAFQPTARGGPKHFVTGNIRIVNMARSLLNHDYRKEIQSSYWMAAHLAEEERADVTDHDWNVWLGAQFGIQDTENRAREKLVMEDQQLYSCPSCNIKFLM